MPLFNSMHMVATHGINSYDMTPRLPQGIPAGRFVVWPKGAPPQNDVPHVGTRVLVLQRGTGAPYGVRPGYDVYVVTLGIPYQRLDGNWRLRVHREKDGVASYPRIEDIRLYTEPPPAPPRTYTADEIMEAVKALDPDLGERIIEHMNGG